MEPQDRDGRRTRELSAVLFVAALLVVGVLVSAVTRELNFWNFALFFLVGIAYRLCLVYTGEE